MASRQDLIDRLSPILGEKDARAFANEIESTAYSAAAEGATTATVTVGRPIMYVSIGAAALSLLALWKTSKKARGISGLPRSYRRRRRPRFGQRRTS